MGLIHRNLADPALIVFLKNRIQSNARLNPVALAELSQGRLGEADIDKSLRNPIYMTASKARELLSLTGLEHEWIRLSAEGRNPRGRGPFGYPCRTFGRVEAWGLADIEQEGISLIEIAKQLVSIDATLFNHFSTGDWVGSAEDWHEALLFEPRAWQVFMNSERQVLGYWMFVAPKDSTFMDACLGGYPEHSITVETLKALGDGPAHIYGPGLYVRSDIRGWDRAMLGSHLLLSFLHAIREAEQDGITFDQICIPVCSEEGRKLAEDRFGLQRMPPVVNERYAREMRWPLIKDGKTLLPAIYLGNLDDALRDRAGLPQKSKPQ